MLEPLHIDITALKEGWGYFVSFGDEKDFDGIAPTLEEALEKVRELCTPQQVDLCLPVETPLT
jgi:predicted RNase H-like HicB family nuclease